MSAHLGLRTLETRESAESWLRGRMGRSPGGPAWVEPWLAAELRALGVGQSMFREDSPSLPAEPREVAETQVFGGHV